MHHLENRWIDIDEIFNWVVLIRFWLKWDESNRHGTVVQIVVVVPGGLGLTLPKEIEKKNC
jgi:hypothetical protein